MLFIRFHRQNMVWNYIILHSEPFGKQTAILWELFTEQASEQILTLKTTVAACSVPSELAGVHVLIAHERLPASIQATSVRIHIYRGNKHVRLSEQRQ
jgi:hypothetical protein